MALPSGQAVWAAGGGTGLASKIDVATNTVTRIETPTTIAVGDDPVAVAVHPQNGDVYVTNSLSGTMSVVDPLTLSVKETVDLGGVLWRGMAIGPAPLSGNTVGGAVSGINTQRIVCRNDTTNEVIQVLSAAASWDCEVFTGAAGIVD